MIKIMFTKTSTTDCRAHGAISENEKPATFLIMFTSIGPKIT